MDIVEFLTARLDEDEQAAVNAQGQPIGSDVPEVAAYLYWWRHERVLAEIAAKRAVLDLHPNVNDGDCGTCVDGEWGYPTNGNAWPSRWPCETVRLLAQPFADHPDFDPAWKVSE